MSQLILPQDKPVRILLTGSRIFPWEGRTWLKHKLLEAWDLCGNPEEVTLVHGKCHLGGADIIGGNIARTDLGWNEEPHPAQGHPTQDFGPWPWCGPKRNQYMVDLGADLCVAFPIGAARGTMDCVRRAKKAGIEDRIFYYEDL